nr:reverse transcriptase domain-containing protein [Tanacetum cinerariifolium]
MVIKSKTEKDMIMDVMETFNNLKKINMKLNPKKCSFRVKEGKFLRYMVTSEGIRANPKKTKAILNKPEASEKLAKYAVELGAYNIAYMPRSAIKGQVEEWTLFTDGASSLKGAGARLVLIDPTRTEYTYAIQLNFTSTNNKVEYEAIDEMAIYLMKAKEISAGFEEFSIENVPRNQNQKAYVLRKLASVAFSHLTKEILVEVLNAKSIEVQEVNAIVEEEGNNWMTPIIKCIEEGPLPEGPGKLKYIIVAIDYFTKWLEAKPLAKISERVGWVDELPNILWAHQMMLKTSNGETPFSLTYGSESVILAEIGMPTYRTIQWNKALNEEEIRLNLDLIQERRETAAIWEAKYKKKMEQYYNKRVRLVSFKVGDFVYRMNEASREENQGKLGLNWEGPCCVVKAYENAPINYVL